ncbi:MAG: phosphotransferase [Chloroflexota bacterium]
MRTLLVEDDEGVVRLLTEATASEPIEWTVAGTREEGERALQDTEFDLLIFDLRLPDRRGDTPRDEAGLSLLDAASSACPGTSTFVLSAYATIDNLRPYQNANDLEGETHALKVTAFTKDDFSPVLTAIRARSEQWTELRRIEIYRGTPPVSLSYHQERVLRLFVRRQHAAKGILLPVGGGLSSASKLRVAIVDSNGGHLLDSIARLTTPAAVRDESERYRTCIAPLRPGFFAHLIDTVEPGAGRTAGLLYRLAEGFDRALADIVIIDPLAAAGTVSQIESGTIVWTAARSWVRRTIGDVRRQLMTDEELTSNRSRAPSFDFGAIEALELVSPALRQHGDLHVFNVLVDANAQPMLIDFADAGVYSAPIDAIALELSLLFHPGVTKRLGPWPTPAQLRTWADVDAWARDSPAPDYIRRCRAWALEIAEGERPVLAAAYAYAARQLKYKDVATERILGVLEAVAERARTAW